MKTEITMKDAVEGVKNIFDVVPFDNHGDEQSFYVEDKECNTVSFYFDKRQYTREDVIEKLCDYFNDKIITDGQCRIDAITLAWTTVHIEPRKIEKKTGIEIIADERKRQLEEEGWSTEHDAQYTHNELIWAAMCYMQPESFRAYDRVCNSKTSNNIKIPTHWPWDEKWWKPTPDDRIRELAKAGALIAAEIDRIQNETNE